MIYAVFISQLRSKSWSDELSDLQQNLRGSLDIMSADFIKADSISVLMNSPDCPWDPYNPGIANNFIILVGNLTESSGKSWVAYYTLKDNGTVGPVSTQFPGTLYRETGAFNAVDPSNTQVIQFPSIAKSQVGYTCSANNFATPIVMANNITSFNMEYLNRQGNPVEPLSYATASETRSVSITLKGSTSRPNPNNNTKLERSLTGRISLRNAWQFAGSGCGMLSFSITPLNVAFCNPPGDVSNFDIALCNLNGIAMGGTVEMYPKQGQPVNITGTNIVSVGTSAFLTIANPPANTVCDGAWKGSGSIAAYNPSAMPAGSGLEIVARWKPTNCAYDIVTSRGISVKAGLANKVALTRDNTNTLRACPSGGCADTVTFQARVTDMCNNPVGNGNTVTFASSGGGSFSPASATTDDASYASSTYTPPDLITSSTSTITAALQGSTATITNDVSLTHCNPSILTAVSDPFSISDTACPSRTNHVKFKVYDACNNHVLTDQLSNLSATTTLGTVTIVNSGTTGIYNANFITDSSCGDAAAGTITISHASIGSSLSAPITLTQCEMPGLDVVAADPKTVPAGCDCNLSDPSTYALITATLRGPHPDSCTPWAGVYANYTFEVDNQTHTANTPGYEGGNTTALVNTSTGTATVKLCGKSSTTPAPSVGDVLKVKAKAAIKYTAGGPVGQTHDDDAYTDLNVNRVTVVAPTITARFMDSTYSTALTNHPLPCSGTSTVYFEVRDCAATTGSISAVVNSINAEDGSLRDSEAVTLTGSSGVYNGSLNVSSEYSAFDSSVLNTVGYDNITLYYNNASNGTSKTASIRASGFNEQFDSGDISAWTISASHDTPRWHIVNTPSGDKSMVYNDGTGYSDGDFNNSATNYGELITPSFNLYDRSNVALSFLTTADTEYSSLLYSLNYQSPSNTYDRRSIYISKNDGSNWTLIEPSGFESSNTKILSMGTKWFTSGYYYRVYLPLSALPAEWDNQTVKLKFRFYSSDSAYNDYKGWMLDNVLVKCTNLFSSTSSPSAPSISGTTISASTVRLTWDTIAGASGYYVAVSNGVIVDDVVKVTAQNCAVAGKFCYEYSTPIWNGLVGHSVFFNASSYNSSDFVSARSNTYRDESATTLAPPTLTCTQKLATGVLKNMIKSYGVVKTLDSVVVSGAMVNFDADGDLGNEDAWGLLTLASGKFCGDNETADVSPAGVNNSPFGNSEGVTGTATASMSGLLTSQPTSFTAGTDACACP